MPYTQQQLDDYWATVKEGGVLEGTGPNSFQGLSDTFTGEEVQYNQDLRNEGYMNRQGAMDFAEQYKVDPAQAQLASERLSGVLEEGGPLMDRARQQSMEQSASRGLLSSSMATGAAQGAVMDRGMEIAQADVDVDTFNVGEQNRAAEQRYGTAGDITGRTQDYQGELGIQQAGYIQDRGLASQQRELQSQEMEQAKQIELGRMGQEHAYSTAEGQRQQAEELQKMQVAQTYNLANMASEQRYNLETMAKTHGYDLSKMSVEQANNLASMNAEQVDTLERMARDQGYSLQTLSVEQVNRIKTLDRETYNRLSQMARQQGYDATNMSNENYYKLQQMDKELNNNLATLNAEQQDTLQQMSTKFGYDTRFLDEQQADKLQSMSSQYSYDKGLQHEKQQDYIYNAMKAYHYEEGLSASNHVRNMENDMLQFTSEKVMEMLKQESGLHAAYLQAYGSIATADISLADKNSQLAKLGQQISGAVRATDAYKDARIWGPGATWYSISGV